MAACMGHQFQEQDAAVGEDVTTRPKVNQFI